MPIVFTPKIKEFMVLAGTKMDIDINTIIDNKFYDRLLKCKTGINQALIDFIITNPDVLCFRMKQHNIFDYFYDKVVIMPTSLSEYNFWLSSLFKIIDLVIDIIDKQDPNIVTEMNDIPNNPKYIRMLQSGIKNHNSLFEKLLSYDFMMTDCVSLTYSIIARGEIQKLKVLYSLYNIEKIPGIFAYALRYGRIEILRFLIDDIGLNINDSLYGNILSLEYFNETIKEIYYCIDIKDCKFKSRVLLSIQDYNASFEKVLDNLKQENINVTIKTIEIWRDVVKYKKYCWDNINFEMVVSKIRPYIKFTIPLTHDFGSEYNQVIFGEKWSNRKYIVEYCIELEKSLNDLQSRYNELDRHIIF